MFFDLLEGFSTKLVLQPEHSLQGNMQDNFNQLERIYHSCWNGSSEIRTCSERAEIFILEL